MRQGDTLGTPMAGNKTPNSFVCDRQMRIVLFQTPQFSRSATIQPLEALNKVDQNES